MEEPTYHFYDPLPPGHIRLLRIHPALSSSDEQIEVDIETVYLGSSPAYVALSYTWGPPTFAAKEAASKEYFTKVPRCYPIHCNGRLLLATRNLRDAMRQLRKLETENARRLFRAGYNRAKPVYTWIDGLCINQNNLQERSQQVAMMGDIYRQADSVMAWIGEWDDGAANAWELTKALADLASQKIEPEVLRFHPDPHETDLWDLVGCKNFSQAQWRDYFLLLGREWFRRTWVIQEVCLGSSSPLILCGSKSFSVLNIANSIIFAYQSQWWLHGFGRLDSDQLSECLSFFNDHPFRHITNIWHRKNHGTNLPFYNLQRFVFGSTTCLDPRDMIYGTIALASEFQAPPGSHHAVDYTWSVREVYATATKRCLSRSASLDVLGLVANREISNCSPDSLPSWCPNYHLLPGKKLPHPIETLLFGEESNRLYNASRETRYLGASMNVSVPDHLQVRGIRCDFICEVSEPLPTINFGYPWLDQAKVLDLLMKMSVAHIPSPTDMLFRTLVHNMPDDEDPTNTKDFYTLQHFKSFFLTQLDPECASPLNEEALINLQPKLARLRQFDPNSEQIFPSEYHYSHFHGDSAIRLTRSALEKTIESSDFDISRAFRLMYTIQAKTIGRCMFRTVEHRLGLCHLSVAAGDEVWLLAGGPTPYILRPLQNGRYLFLGETYTHGIMQGEAWPDDDSNLTSVTLE